MKSVNPNTGIKGMDVVLSRLNKEITAIKDRTMVGLMEAAILIRRDMDETPPLIPVDTGNLRQSWFVETFRSSTVWGLIMGFSANYAVFVHEMLGKTKKINWSRPGSGPKFFEASLKRNEQQVLETIRDNAQIS